ncbi:MAG: hypothetical protein K6U87_14470 [Firmicutes bacterium]|nr:hypothetical protein [Bacillota bacterium]
MGVDRRAVRDGHLPVGRWQWWCWPWAWLWSDLERDRLGPWRLALRMAWSWGLPAWWATGVPGVIAAGALATCIPWAVQRRAIAAARRAGIRTWFRAPASWGVWLATCRACGIDPGRWPGVPVYERHTVEARWGGPGIPPAEAAARFRAARQAEWRAIAAAEADPPAWILISHTFATRGGARPRLGAEAAGTPFHHLARREARALPGVQRRMFGGAVTADAGALADPGRWRVSVWPVGGGGSPPSLGHGEGG